jgi:nitroreductase
MASTNVNGWSIGLDGAPGPFVRDCLEAAVAAPSIHNTQPWRFRPHDGCIDVYADVRRRLEVTDPRGREMFISVGAAVFNLRVAILVRGRLAAVRLLPEPDEPQLAARVILGPPTTVDETVRALARAIPHRRTNRGPFANVPVPEPLLAELAEAAHVEQASLSISDSTAMLAILGLVRTADERQRRNLPYLAELAKWTDRDPDRRDGVPPEAHGPWVALETVPLRDFGLPRRPRFRRTARFEREPTLAVLYTAGDSPEQWLRAGQALERVLLTATVRGLAATPMTQPIEIPQLRALLSDGTGRSAQVILRLGYGAPAAASPRRPIDEVLMAAAPERHPLT